MNKYNLDFYETLITANEYFDEIEDVINVLNYAYKDEPEKLQQILSTMQNDHEGLLVMEDRLNIFLENNEYQDVCNQLVIIEIMCILMRDAIPENDLGYVADYLESLSEDQLIEDVTRIIDKYNEEVM